MRRVINIESALLKPESFRVKLGTQMKKCQVEATAYHACVSKNLLETEEKECEKEFQELKRCLQL